MNKIKPIIEHWQNSTITYFNSTKSSYKKDDNAGNTTYYSYNTIIAYHPAHSKFIYANPSEYSVTTSKQWSVYIAPDIRNTFGNIEIIYRQERGYELTSIVEEYKEV